MLQIRYKGTLFEGKQSAIESIVFCFLNAHLIYSFIIIYTMYANQKGKWLEENLIVSYYCSACNYDDSTGKYGSTKGNHGNTLKIGDVAIHPNQPCYYLKDYVFINNSKFYIADSCGTYGRIDFWDGQHKQRPLGKNCQFCKKKGGLNGKVVTVKWFEPQ